MQKKHCKQGKQQKTLKTSETSENAAKKEKQLFLTSEKLQQQLTKHLTLSLSKFLERNYTNHDLIIFQKKMLIKLVRD